MANEMIPFWEDGDDLPCYASAAVTGKRFVQITGNKHITGVGTGQSLGLDTAATGGNYSAGLPSAAGAAGAGAICLGVAKYDAAQGAVFGVKCVGIVPVTPVADITAGQEVEVDVNGKVKPLASGKAVGLCMTGVTVASGIDAEIKLYSNGH
jgi:Uncharacterized conserved protein (DUF2190)